MHADAIYLTNLSCREPRRGEDVCFAGVDAVVVVVRAALSFALRISASISCGVPAGRKEGRKDGWKEENS